MMVAEKNRKLCPAVVAVLLLIICVAAYKFIVAGKTEVAADGRVTIILAPGERALILTEMRLFLNAVQGITEALTRDDLPAVAKAARAMGRAATHEVPPGLIAKLPLEFKQLGFAVHSDFDQIAMDATSFGDSKHTMTQLSATLQKCVACHQAFQLRVDIPRI